MLGSQCPGAEHGVEEATAGGEAAEEAEEVVWCGSVLRAVASREIAPGDELLWCITNITYINKGRAALVLPRV